MAHDNPIDIQGAAADVVTGDSSPDPRVAAFCSPERPEVFHAIAYRNDLWKDDPFDVESIHDDARAAYQRLVNRATTSSATGRILLLLGEAGCGKTHLMRRAFRNWTHSRARGYCGYLQMTTSTSHYGRYILNNLIDSLDQPYYEPSGSVTGLMRLSTALAESSRDVPRVRIDQLREDDLGPDCLGRVIDALADQIVVDERFNEVDLDLIRALLYLQRNDPRIKGRVLKYLRCDELSESDRAMLGGLVPRHYDSAPQRLIRRLGRLMWAVEQAPLVLCVDQLEDIYNLDDAPTTFRRAIATLCDLVSHVPSLIVVISCLDDFYQVLANHLTQPLRDRIENDPKPLSLRGPRTEDECVKLVSLRLEHLYESMGARFREEDLTFPFPQGEVRQRAGQRTRDVLSWCQEYRERCVAAGTLVPLDESSAAPAVAPAASTTTLEQAWNDFRTSFVAEIPVAEEELAALLAEAIASCADELATGPRFEAEVHGRMVTVSRIEPGRAVERLQVGVCNKNPQGGALGRQIAEVANEAGADTPVVVRSTEFPSNPKAEVVKLLGDLIAKGGRRAVVEDSDWRAMRAMQAFRAERGSAPTFADWLRNERPLSQLKSLRTILDLDRQKPPREIEDRDRPRARRDTSVDGTYRETF